MRRRPAVLATLLIGAVFAAGRVAAHGLDVEILPHAPAVVIRASYSGAEAAAYAAVKVFAPGNSRVEFQSGHADAAGRFAFLPDRDGEWRVVVDDELGHRQERRLAIGGKFLETGETLSTGRRPPPFPIWSRAFVGVAVIFGVSGFLYGFRARRRAGD